MNDYSIVVLGSGQASTIEFFCKKAKSRNPPFEIKALVTDNPRSGVVKMAKQFHLPCHVVEYTDKDFAAWDKELNQVLLLYKPRLVLLAGFLKKIGPVVLNRFKSKIINSHPSLLPEFSGHGMYGSKVHQAVIREQKKQTGVSIHVVNKNYDEGALLAQKKIQVQKRETALSLEKRVKKQEKIFYLETVMKILKGEIPLS